MNKKMYETPCTQHVEVELEEGVMISASVFDPNDNENREVYTDQHVVNPEMQDFFDSSNGGAWDN